MCLNIRIPHKKYQPFLNTHILHIIIYCIYLNKSYLVGKQPPPWEKSRSPLRHSLFFGGETSWVGKSPGATGNKATWQFLSLRRFKKGVLNQNEGLFGNTFFGKIDMRWGVLLRYVYRICADIYFDMKLQAVWDQFVLRSMHLLFNTMFHTSSWRLPDWSQWGKTRRKKLNVGVSQETVFTPSGWAYEHSLIDCLVIPGTTWRSRPFTT